ncbi:MAG: Gfo/Idh/MocA family protein [Bacillota bacterium]
MGYGVGFYGCGFIGKVHVYAYNNLSFFYDPPAFQPKLVGVCTSSDKSAKKVKKQLNFKTYTTDYRDLLNNDEIDIVHCVTPNYLHHDFVVDAIKANKHIYCEKPLALNYKEAENIKKVAEKENYQKKFQITHQYRYFPATLKAKSLIENGFLGKVFGFRAQYLHSGYIDNNRPMSWRLEEEKAGSGALGDLGSHLLDLMYYLLGPYKKVTASQKTFVKKRPISRDSNKTEEVKVDDITTSLIHLKNGATGTLEAWRLATGSEDELRFEVHGSKGGLKFNLMKPNWLEVYDNTEADQPLGGEKGWKKISTIQRYPEPAVFPGGKCPIGWMRAHVECLHSFLISIKEDKNTSPSLEEGIYIQKIIENIKKASSEEEFIEL